MQSRLILKLHNHIDDHLRAHIPQANRRKLHEAVDWMEKEFADELAAHDRKAAQVRESAAVVPRQSQTKPTPPVSVKKAIRPIESISGTAMGYLAAGGAKLNRGDER